MQSPDPPAERSIDPQKFLAAVAICMVVALASFGVLRAIEKHNQTPGGLSSQDARLVLELAATTGRLQARKSVGTWVPQLLADRSKEARFPALLPASVLLDYRTASKRFGALLLRSTDYDFDGPDAYVSIGPKGYKSAGKARAWCQAAGLASDRCIAKRLARAPDKR